MNRSNDPTKMDREFDLILFGLTGYTGYFVARELLLTIQKDNDPKIKQLKWAVAGRNVEKLQETLTKLREEIEFEHDSITKIKADVGDYESLVNMAKRTQVVVNTVGPYRFYGRPVVEACVRSKTHHLDISGESEYIEQSVLEFYETAKENGTLIISTCGWDSIPNDMGVHYLKKNFDGTLHSVESFCKNLPGPKGYPINVGTFRSAIYEIAFGERVIKTIRKRLDAEIFKKELPTSRKQLKLKIIPFKNDKVDGVNVMFPSGDGPVVNRTQHHCYEEYNERPVQINTYVTLTSYLYVAGLMAMTAIFGSLVFLSCGRKLLEKYPGFFTFGYFSSKGPTREQVETSRFRSVLIGKGWSTKENDPNKEPSGEMDKQVVLTIEGEDPAYRATSTFLMQSALTICLQRDLMPKGGVITPAFAFRNTSLIDRLKNRGVKFTLE